MNSIIEEVKLGEARF